MTKLTSKLVAAKVKGKPGDFSDGGGLYLVVPKRGRSYWVLRYTVNSKRKKMTLAPVDELSLADARVEAALKKKQLREGPDPTAGIHTRHRPCYWGDATIRCHRARH